VPQDEAVRLGTPALVVHTGDIAADPRVGRLRAVTLYEPGGPVRAVSDERRIAADAVPVFRDAADRLRLS
jgi:hypothetical protein